MFQPLPPGWKESERATSGGAGQQRSRRGVYMLLLGLGLLAGAYAFQRARSSDSTVSADAVRERAGEALPVDESDLPVVGSTDATGPEEESDVADEELPGEDRSPEELEERTEEDIQEEPAEPGEMNIGEDVAEEVVDDSAEEDEETDTS